MPKLPWFPFYGRDFFEDEKVQTLNYLQIGLYLRFLQHQWIEGSLSEDTALTLATSRPHTDQFYDNRGRKLSKSCPNLVQEARHVLTMFFTTLTLDGRRMMNPRLESIRAEQLQKEAIHHEKSVKGGLSRAKAFTQPQASHRVNEIVPQARQSESERERDKNNLKSVFPVDNLEQNGYSELQTVIIKLAQSKGMDNA